MMRSMSTVAMGLLALAASLWLLWSEQSRGASVTMPASAAAPLVSR